jgi:hypothetical protein
MERCFSRLPASWSRRALDHGGICSIAGIHLSDVPTLNYGLPPYVRSQWQGASDEVYGTIRADASAHRQALPEAGARAAEVRTEFGILLSPIVPCGNSLPDDLKVFFVSHRLSRHFATAALNKKA